MAAKKTGGSGGQRGELMPLIDELAMLLLNVDSIDEIARAAVQVLLSRLSLPDLVIYAAEAGYLIQHAAAGSRSDLYGSVMADSMSVPIGKGAAGIAASSAAPVIIKDTRRDDRYIATVEGQRSALAVPILLHGQVLGAIESEHAKIDYFTDQHVAAFQAVASMIAPRIAAARELEATRAELVELRRQLHDARYHVSDAPGGVAESSAPHYAPSMPMKRAVNGGDLESLYKKTNWSLTRFCAAIGLSPSSYKMLTQDPKAPLDNIAVALTVRWLDAFPELLREPVAVPALRDALEGLIDFDQNDLAVMLGRRQSSISLALKTGRSSEAVDSLARSIAAIISRQPGLIETYREIVSAEAKARGIKNIWKSKRWTQ